MKTRALFRLRWLFSRFAHGSKNKSRRRLAALLLFVFASRADRVKEAPPVCGDVPRKWEPKEGRPLPVLLPNGSKPFGAWGKVRKKGDVGPGLDELVAWQPAPLLVGFLQKFTCYCGKLE